MVILRFSTAATDALDWSFAFQKVHHFKLVEKELRRFDTLTILTVWLAVLDVRDYMLWGATPQCRMQTTVVSFMSNGWIDVDKTDPFEEARKQNRKTVLWFTMAHRL